MFLCLVILSVAAVCDVYSGRIPREVTCFGMLVSQLWIISHRSVDEALIAIAGSFGIMILVLLVKPTGLMVIFR